MNGSGQRVRLRGVCVSGLLHLENYMVGFPGTETAMRSALAAEIGADRAQRFLDRLNAAMFTEDDMAHLAGVGANVVRLAIGHRNLVDPAAPDRYDEGSLRRIDDVLAWGERHGVYVILDLHSAPGGQNNDWHGDNSHRHAMLWRDEASQRQFVDLWETLARRYRGREVVAAFDLMNEPVSGAPLGRFGNAYSPDWGAFNDVYARLIEAVHAIDLARIVVVEGDQWGTRFDGIDLPMANVLFSAHHYHNSLRRSHEYPGEQPDGTVWDIALHRCLMAGHEGVRWAASRGLDLWLGEFGVGYWDGLPESRVRARDDQLTVFDEHELHWTYWNYKDIGCAGVVHADPGSSYRLLVDPFVQLKNELSTDPSNSHLIAPDVLEPLMRLADAAWSRIPDATDRSGFTTFMGQAVLVNYVAHAMQPAWARLFAGRSDEELADLADSFRLDRCVEQSSLTDVLRRHFADSPRPT